MVVRPSFIPGHFIQHISNELCKVSLLGKPKKVLLKDVKLVQAPFFNESHKPYRFEYFDEDLDEWLTCNLNSFNDKAGLLEVRWVQSRRNGAQYTWMSQHTLKIRPLYFVDDLD